MYPDVPSLQLGKDLEVDLVMPVVKKSPHSLQVLSLTKATKCILARSQRVTLYSPEKEVTHCEFTFPVHLWFERCRCDVLPKPNTDLRVLFVLSQIHEEYLPIFNTLNKTVIQKVKHIIYGLVKDICRKTCSYQVWQFSPRLHYSTDYSELPEWRRRLVLRKIKLRNNKIRKALALESYHERDICE